MNTVGCGSIANNFSNYFVSFADGVRKDGPTHRDRRLLFVRPVLVMLSGD